MIQTKFVILNTSFLQYYQPDGLEHWNNADVADTVVDVFDILAGFITSSTDNA